MRTVRKKENRRIKEIYTKEQKNKEKRQKNKKKKKQPRHQ